MRDSPKKSMLKEKEGGKIALIFVLGSLAVFFLVSIFDFQYIGESKSALATSTATTTIRVLNTPPQWTETAREMYPSATTSPTNVGTSTVWTAIATDNNSENYVLLVCKSSSTPQHPFQPGNPTPQCGGGATDQWAISATTTSAERATASIVAQDTVDFAEKNNWYAYICDLNIGEPACNRTMYNGLHEAGPASATSSPFVVNRPAVVSSVFNTASANPGDTVTWTAMATDTVDVIRGGDNLRVFVCKESGFDATVPECTGETWAVSAFFNQGTLSTSTALAIPTQDGQRISYFYVIDEFGLPAVGAGQGATDLLTVNNVPPYIGGVTSFGLYGVYGSTTVNTNLILSEPEGETHNFVTQFDVSDHNGCLNVDSNPEVESIDLNVFRSGVGLQDGTGCDGDDPHNPNYCYTHTYQYWDYNCYQVPGQTCTGDTLYTTWECTFPLWFVADPTDIGSQFSGDYWMASARAIDDNSAVGAYGTSTTNTNMVQFMSFRATGSPIAYGELEPGFDTVTHVASTTVYATGNTGLNQYLSGDPMCVTYPNCSGLDSDTIYVNNQRFSLAATTPFLSGTILTASTSPTFLNMDIGKTTSTSSLAFDITYWAIAVPGSITFAGDYIGRNYIDSIIAPSGEW